MSYFHNDLRRIKDSHFLPVAAEAVFTDLVYSWELPSSCCCMIRATAPDGKVSEFIYKRKDHAAKRLEKLLDDDYQITVAGHDHIIQL